jgi:hypothetical protein
VGWDAVSFRFVSACDAGVVVGIVGVACHRDGSKFLRCCIADAAPDRIHFLFYFVSFRLVQCTFGRAYGVKQASKIKSKKAISEYVHEQ